jgi:hypothetical protein
MKKLIFVILFIPLIGKSQTFVVVEPMFFQVGFMQHVPVTEKYGSYFVLRSGDIDQDQFHTDILKFGLGTSIKLDQRNSLLLGLTYYQINNLFDENPAFDLRHVSKLSFDFGFMIQPKKDGILYLTVLSDFINWETQIGVGVKF